MPFRLNNLKVKKSLTLFLKCVYNTYMDTNINKSDNAVRRTVANINIPNKLYGVNIMSKQKTEIEVVQADNKLSDTVVTEYTSTINNVISNWQVSDDTQMLDFVKLVRVTRSLYNDLDNLLISNTGAGIKTDARDNQFKAGKELYNKTFPSTFVKMLGFDSLVKFQAQYTKIKKLIETKSLGSEGSAESFELNLSDIPHLRKYFSEYSIQSIRNLGGLVPLCIKEIVRPFPLEKKERKPKSDKPSNSDFNLEKFSKHLEYFKLNLVKFHNEKDTRKITQEIIVTVENTAKLYNDIKDKLKK